MKTGASVFLAAGVAAILTIYSTAMFAQDAQSEHGRPEPSAAGVHWAKGEKPEAPGESGKAPGQAGKGGKPSPNMAYHGGPIMQSVAVIPIFWGANWANPAFVGDKIDGINLFYAGIGGSKFAATSNEYYQPGIAGTAYLQVTSAITSMPALKDFSAAVTNGSRTAPILTEVCKVLALNGISPLSNGYYPVYIDSPRGSAGYCAWHSAGSCGNVPVQFAFFFNLDGDAGCDPKDDSTPHSQGLAALANVSGHEISETQSDPRLNAWYDSAGEENADKCAWVFNTVPLTFTDDSKWKIQGNWSNTAYTKGTGYANSSGQPGCIDGGQ
jgi:hypothetical protein